MPAGPLFDVLGVGTNSVDTVLQLPRGMSSASQPSKIRVRTKTVRMGGQTATALATCASLGLRTAYLGAIGSDESGRLMRAELTRRGIDLRYTVERDTPNHFAVILVDESTGDRTVLWGHEATLHLAPTEITLEHVAAARVLHVDDVDVDAAIRAAELAQRAGVAVTSDLDRLDEKTPALVRAVSFPIFAEHMPAALTGETDHERALRTLRREHAGVLCVTLGERGAVALDGDRLIEVPGVRVAAVDTTGAGDVFRGGFIYGVINGWAIDKVLAFATAAAAVSCTKAGAMDGVPTQEEIDAVWRA